MNILHDWLKKDVKIDITNVSKDNKARVNV